MTTAQRAAAKQPQDHKMPEGDFEYDGARYHVPPAEEWDLDVFEALEEGKLVTGVKALLGPEQYAMFRKEHRTLKELTAFMEALQKAANAGN